MQQNLLEELLGDDVITAPPETITFITQAGAADAGQAAGVCVFSKLSKRHVLNLFGSHIGDKNGEAYATSIVFTTGVMDSSKEIQWDYSKNGNTAQIDNMVAVVTAAAQGSWACDYLTGLLVINKKTTGISQVITSYKYATRNKALNDPTTTVAITVSDSTDLTATVTKGIFVSVALGTTAIIAFKLVGDSAAQSVTLSSSQFLPGSFARVMNTGTTLNGNTIVGYGG